MNPNNDDFVEDIQNGKEGKNTRRMDFLLLHKWKDVVHEAKIEGLLATNKKFEVRI
ncbi:MAG: hypothetical protein AAFO82_03260 [Bacteroidota bacterium]